VSGPNDSPRHLGIPVIGEDFLDVLASVEHAHNFRPTIVQPIKYDVRSSSKLPQACTDFVTPASG